MSLSVSISVSNKQTTSVFSVNINVKQTNNANITVEQTNNVCVKQTNNVCVKQTNNVCVKQTKNIIFSSKIVFKQTNKQCQCQRQTNQQCQFSESISV